METRIVAAEPSAREALRNLFQLYAYDFSEVLPLEVAETGRFDVESAIDTCWADPSRFPFLFRAGVHIAGFAIVDHKSKLTGASDVWDMAEFFVLRRYRRAGIGTALAHRLFAAHPGEWEVRQRGTNRAATAFWRRAIAAYTGDRFREELFDDDRWRGPVQRFTSACMTRSP
jgi:predicted acetyltransferase